MTKSSVEWFESLSEEKQENFRIPAPSADASWHGEDGWKAFFSQPKAELALRKILKASVMPGGEAAARTDLMSESLRVPSGLSTCAEWGKHLGLFELKAENAKADGVEEGQIVSALIHNVLTNYSTLAQQIEALKSTDFNTCLQHLLSEMVKLSTRACHTYLMVEIVRLSTRAYHT